MEESKLYCLRDERYLGLGCLFVVEYKGEIIKFIKISELPGGMLPGFMIRAYKKDSFDSQNEDFRTIEIHISREENEELFEVFKKASKSLNGEKIYTIDSLEQGRNHLSFKVEGNKASLLLYKDIWNGKNLNNNHIDIYLGDNYSCGQYEVIRRFYNGLIKATKGKSDEEFIRKILK